MKNFRFDEKKVAVLGVAVTVLLYVMNVFGTGIIVGGDIGSIDTDIPFYGLVAPLMFTFFAAFAGWYTKKYSMKKAFLSVYITLLLPYVSYPLVFIFNGTPLMAIPMLVCMPLASLGTYIIEEYCEFLQIPSYNMGNGILVLVTAVMLIPIVIAPIVYGFTKNETAEITG